MNDATPLWIRLLISWLTNALVLGVVAAVLSRVHVNSAGSLLFAAAVFGVLNTLFKPLLRLITLPAALLTFGLAWFFVSMLMLDLTDAIASGFFIHGFWTLVWATVIVRSTPSSASAIAHQSANHGTAASATAVSVDS